MSEDANNALRALQQIAAEHRQTGKPINIGAILAEARDIGLRVDADMIGDLMLHYGSRFDTGELTCPKLIVDFITAVASGGDIRTVLDPWAGRGLLLAPLVDALGATTAVGLIREPSAAQVATALETRCKVSWVCSDPLEEIEHFTDSFDLVVGELPLGLKRTKSVFDGQAGPVQLLDEYGYILLLKSCLQLRAGGLGVFLVGPRFIQQSESKAVFNNLARFGISLDAYISVPAQVTGYPFTTPRVLVVLKRSEQRRLFVGELSDNKERNQVLLSNLKSHRSGKEISLGTIVSLESFQGYYALEADRRIREMVRWIGLQPTPMADVAEIHRTYTSEPSGFDDKPNAVYLPLIGMGKAITSAGELTMKPHNYAQIVMDPGKVTARYLAGFFNTPLGHEIRNRAMSGTTIPKLTSQTIQAMDVYIPDLDTQSRMLEIGTRISTLTSELHELERVLWEQPKRTDAVAEQLNSVNRDDRFEHWLDSVPFPLASILWAHKTVDPDNMDTRCEHLLHFFEALAEFLAIILMSAFRSDNDLFRAEVIELSRTLADNHLTIGTSSFGTWVRIVERLSKSARQLLNESDARIRCQCMFSTTNQDVLEMVTSRRIVTVLNDTNNLRNAWLGHSGIVGIQEARQRHAVLENYLASVRDVFGTYWERYELIIPRNCRIKDGIYYYTAHRVMGARTPFAAMQLQLSHPMDDGQLYLYAPNESKALGLLPLIKVMPSPSTELNACYFYNRYNGNTQRFISYHFEKEAEVNQSFPDTAKALQVLLHPTK